MEKLSMFITQNNKAVPPQLMKIQRILSDFFLFLLKFIKLLMNTDLIWGEKYRTTTN